MRKLTMMVVVMAVMLAMAGALAFSPKVAEAAPPPRAWCYTGNLVVACFPPAPGESDAQVRAKCEAALANDPNATSKRCTPNNNFPV
jgi:hypothetical protein